MTLDALIRLHRNLLRDELTMQMTATAMPADPDAPVVRAKPRTQSGNEYGWTGVPLSVPFTRYLEGQYGASFPYSAALALLYRECSRSHLGHAERPEWRGALCHKLVRWVVYWHTDPDDAAALFGIPVEDAERLLTGALRLIDQHLTARKAPPSEKAEPDEYSPSRLSRAVCEAVNREVRDFDLEQRIWGALRYRDPTLHEWDTEWAKRQARIIEHRATCERCRIEEAA